jgi:DNA topoisomerase-1
MLLRDSKRGPFLGCSSFPKCRSTRMVKKLEGADLKQVEALLPLLKEEAAKAQALVAKIIADNPAAAGNGAARPASIPTDIDCDECGKPMIIRSGKRGRFLGCSGYPKCKHTDEVPAKLLEELGIDANGAPAAPAKPAPAEDDIDVDLAVE